MQKLNNRNAFILFTTLILSVITAIYRCFINAYAIEKETGLYKDALLGNIFFGIILFVAILSFFLYLYLKNKNIKIESLSNGMFSKVSAFLCVLALVAQTIYSCINFNKWYNTLDILTSICSVIFFAFICFKGSKNDTGKTSFGLFEMFVSLFLAYKTIFLFIDTSTQMNASSRSYTLLYIVCAMLFFLFEASLYIFKSCDPCFNTPCFYAFGYFSFFLAVSVCLPACVMFSSIYTSSIPLITNLVYLTMGLYIFSRLVNYK